MDECHGRKQFPALRLITVYSASRNHRAEGLDALGHSIIY